METNVDFVLENLTKLLNTDDELILIAYEEKPTMKEQIKWLYEEMHSMMKFLKDSEDKPNELDEKVKDVAAKIRDVTGEVDDIVDSFILTTHIQKHMFFVLMEHGWDEEIRIEQGVLSEHFKSLTENIMSQPKKISDLLKTWEERIDHFQRSWEEMMVIFEGLECLGRHNIYEGPLRCMQQIMPIGTLLKNSRLFRGMLKNIFHDESDDLSHVQMMGSRLASPAFCVGDDCLLLSNMLKEMIFFKVEEFDSICEVIQVIESLKSRLEKVLDKGLSPTWLNSDIGVECCRLLTSCVKMVDQAEKVHRAYDCVRDEIQCIQSEVMKIRKSGLMFSWLGSLLANIISGRFGSVIEEIKSIKAQVVEIYGSGVLQIGDSSQRASTRVPRLIVDEEIIVGFDDEEKTVMELLVGEHDRQLKRISIVGMPGLGKTTLAKKVYNHPYIVGHFSTRAWTYVSQAYQKRDLLISILCSVFNFRDENFELSNEKLGEKLYRGLKRNRYLIVMDDIWSIEAWDDFRRYFPDDNNGSRILFTSRVLEVAKALHSISHPLRFLDEGEGWDLFRQRVFQKENCPTELMEIGKQIAKRCGGLPLAIVVIAGLLKKKDKTLEWWRHVASSVGSYIADNPEEYMDTLALSYNHLPHHLKSCYLYFSAFPEDYEIPVWKLVSLWTAEGFIRQIGEKILEDVAQDYLMDLVDRSLVLVARRSSTGGIKSCRVHDLLHELCLKKAKEENFLEQNRWYEEDKQFFLSIAAKQRRLCVHSHIFLSITSEFSALHIRSFLYFGPQQNPISPNCISFIERCFSLLRVLDLSSIGISYFSHSIAQLVFLRYLAIKGKELKLPSIISELRNLETLIVLGELYDLPTGVWEIEKLRHLRIGGQNFIQYSPRESMDGYPVILDSLQTISQVCPSSGCEEVLARTPNLRKLVLSGVFTIDHGYFWFPDLDLLNHLEILKLLHRDVHVPGHQKYNLHRVKFPPNLKRLTLSNTALKWEDMSILGSLPNLESLKLEFQACVGPQWETSDGGFCRLKFLRFYYMNIEQWYASSDHFPVLERLVLHRCRKLEDIPSDLGYIDTLQMIEVSCCSESVINSAKNIQKEQQEDMGNEFLKILIINPMDSELSLSSTELY